MPPYRIIARKEIYHGKIIEVVEEGIQFGDGRLATRELVLHHGAAAVLPITAEGQVALVRQYRHAAAQYAWEIPAGLCEPGEDPACCAARELAEETGYRAGELRFLTSFYSSLGFCTEQIHLYLARQLSPGPLDLDEDEEVELALYSLEEALAMVFDGRLIDAKTMVALLAYQQLRQTGEI